MPNTQFLRRLPLASILAAASIHTAEVRAADIAELRKQALEFFSPLPEKMPGSENDTSVQVELGRKLYFEKRLSMNNTQSCNSCHDVSQGRAGVDNEPTSPGAFGKRGDRNSPTTLNAGFQFAQFWDGRAPDLKEQAKGPVLNPVEMAMPDEKVVIERLHGDPEYTKLFKAAFPDAENPITYDNVAHAIAAFERTLITRDRFDDFLRGKDDALSTSELKGLETFLAVGCTTCHSGSLLGGNSYQKVGLVNAYPNQKDLGRFVVTRDENDKFKFKVPTLRNIAATFPYFHDGAAADLRAAVRTMASIQLGLELNKDQEDHLVAFLETLTGKGIVVPGEPVRAAETGAQ